MNIERLLLVTETLRIEFKRINLVEMVRAVTAAITNQINQPNDQHLAQITASLDALKNGLAKSSLNEVPKTWQPTLEAIEFDDLVGMQLYDQVRGAIAESQPLLNESKTKIERIQARIENLMAAFGELHSACKKLKIQPETLAPGEVELSVLLPREIFSNRWDSFLGEGQLVDRLIKTSSQIVTGSAESAQIRQLSTTDPLIVLVAPPAVIIFVMKVINMVLDAYHKVQLIRETKAKAEQAELGTKFIKQLQDEAMKKIHEHVEGFLQEVSKAREGVALAGADLTDALNKLRDVSLKIAARIDRGMRIDAAVEEPANEEAEQENGGISSADAATLRKLATNVKYFEIEGAPILGLPQPEYSEEDELPATT